MSKRLTDVIQAFADKRISLATLHTSAQEILAQTCATARTEGYSDGQGIERIKIEQEMNKLRDQLRQWISTSKLLYDAIVSYKGVKA